MKRLCRFYVAVFLIAGSTPCLADWFSDTQGIMGTEVSVTLWHEDASQAKSVIARVMAEMRRIDQALSPYIESSELSRVNAQAYEKTQTLSEELAFLIEKSLEFSVLSGGAFDITFASVARYYDYRNKLKPSEQERLAALPAIDYHWLEFDKATRSLRFKHDKVHIDLGGIAKGYAVDRAIAILEQYEVRHASVSAGGDSRLLGNRHGRPWVIGVKHPRPAVGDREAVIRLPLSDTAVSTSGDYERYFIDDETGERIHHILQPRTGKSASEVMSVTVLGRRGVYTDPLSTTVFVLGVEKGLGLVNGLNGFDAIIIDSRGKVHYSEGLTAP